MSAAEIDHVALTALRLLPDEPDRAMRLWDDAFARASASAHEGMARSLLRLRIVRMHHQSRFGDREALESQMLAASAEARAHGWRVESLLVDLLEVYLATLGSNHDDGLRDVEAIRAEAEAHLDPIELSGLELMAGHFRGYMLGWAHEPERTYRALSRLTASPQAPPGLIAHVQTNIGQSHLLVGNVDLASTYLQEADLDHFKAVNDIHGHHMGDLVLEGFADLVRDGFRAHDLCCRHGGEEFCVVMADTDDIAAHERVEELQERLGARVFRSGERELTRVGFSAGIVTFKADPRMDLDLVFRRADQALYASKNGGRRRISALELA